MPRNCCQLRTLQSYVPSSYCRVLRLDVHDGIKSLHELFPNRFENRVLELLISFDLMQKQRH